MATDAKRSEVGVAALRPLLRQILARASTGEEIIITVDGEPKAMLGPLPEDKKEKS